jgi:hypothetical protein
MPATRKLPQRISPQEDSDRSILAALLRMAAERDSRLNPGEQSARDKVQP